jgi:hypothetical protein
VEGSPGKPGGGVLAALAVALQSSHDVDPAQLHGNASASAAALRARQQEAPPAKPQWGVTGVHSGSGGHIGTAGGAFETEPTSGAGASRDAGLAIDSTEGAVMHGSSGANGDRSVSWWLYAYVCQCVFHNLRAATWLACWRSC